MFFFSNEEQHAFNSLDNHFRQDIKQENLYLAQELKKGGNMGNKFPEPMSVFRNQVIRRGLVIIFRNQ